MTTVISSGLPLVTAATKLHMPLSSNVVAVHNAQILTLRLQPYENFI